MKLKSVVLMLLLLSLCAVVTGCSGSAQNRAAVDVDISAMPAATAYSFASELFYGDSEAYRNCTVRVSGEYTQSYFDATGLYYDYVVVFDCTNSSGGCNVSVQGCDCEIDTKWEVDANAQPLKTFAIDITNTYVEFAGSPQYQIEVLGNRWHMHKF